MEMLSHSNLLQGRVELYYIMTLVDVAKEHLIENKMTYREHFVFGMRHGFSCLRAGTYLLIHAILPCFHRGAGSNLVAKLNKHFTDWRKLTEEKADNV